MGCCASTEAGGQHSVPDTEIPLSPLQLPAHKLPARPPTGDRPQVSPSLISSSTGGHYPGPGFAGAPSASVRPGSVGSCATAISNLSVQSAESARASLDSIQRSQSIQAIVRIISADLGDLTNTIRQLERWFEEIDPSRYRKREPWSGAMQRAHRRYKDLADLSGPATRAFEEYRAHMGSSPKPEECVEAARLAIASGEAAVVAADARVEFMTIYRNAYQLNGIQGHIKAAKDQIQTGKRAVYNARKNYVKIWENVGRRADPAIFQ